MFHVRVKMLEEHAFSDFVVREVLRVEVGVYFSWRGFGAVRVLAKECG